MTKLNMTRDKAGKNTFGLAFSDHKYNTTLLNLVEQILTIPGDYDKWLAIFSIEPGAEVWVAKNQTSQVAGPSMLPTTSELNPVAREVAAGDTLRFITSNVDARIGITLYERDQN